MNELIEKNECFFNTEGKTQDQLRSSLFEIENILINHVEKYDCSAEFPIKHYRIGRLYARECFIPAGSMLVGKTHSGVSISVCSMGDISVMTELGTMRIKAPFTCTAEAGIKRVGYAHADTIWISIHETDCENMENIVDELTILSNDKLKEIRGLS